MKSLKYFRVNCFCKSTSGRMAGFVKKTTGFTGLAVDPLAPQKLVRLYKATLQAIKGMPATYTYRQTTERLINERLAIVESETDPIKIEQKINDGQIEHLVLFADREFHLAKNLAANKAWEPLVEEAPKNQWKWPV